MIIIACTESERVSQGLSAVAKCKSPQLHIHSESDKSIGDRAPLTGLSSLDWNRILSVKTVDADDQLVIVC